MLQRRRNCKNSKVLPSIHPPDRSSSRIRTLLRKLSGRLQELQNEVNCMNDSKDFRDAESICSGNSHVTSQPGLFPKHPPFGGLLRPSFVSPQSTGGPPNIWDTSGMSGNVFCQSTSFLFSSLSSRIELSVEELLKNRFTCLQRRRVRDQNEIKI